MKEFSGFPARMEFTPIPNLFLSSLLPEISDIAELKTTLSALGALYHKHGYPRFVTYRELQGNISLIRSLKNSEMPPDEALRQALKKATERGTLLHLAVERDKTTEDIYFLNTEQNRETLSKIKSGELKLSGLKISEPIVAEAQELPDIFTLYEQNIGMLTPLISEELKEAEKLYPQVWIKEAIGEAVARNKRNWRYISAILERWATEGKGDGTYKRAFKRKTDPDKYIKGKYGHMVKR